VRSVRGTGLPAGALVNTVDRGSNAERAGLKAGDLIVAVDAVSVALLEPEDVPAFRRALSEREVGTSIALRVLREGKEKQLSYASVAQDDLRSPQVEVPELGLSVSSLTESMARARYLKSRKGALVQGLRPGGPATTALPPLAVGDLIVEFDGKPISSADRLLAAKIQPSTDWRQLKIDRRGEQLVALIRPAPKRIIPENLNELVKAWAGWEVQPVTQPMAAALSLPGPGFRITRIYPDGPAAKAGLQVGDLLQSLDEVPVRPSGIKETQALDLRIRNASTSEDLQVQVWRGDQALQRPLRVIEQPLTIEASERRWNAELSITVRDLTVFDRVQRSLAKNQQGVVVERVENGGYGGLAHLKEGDLIVRIDGAEVAHVADLELQLSAARRASRGKLSLMVMRGADSRLLFVDPPWKDDRS
jgi:serine protease Do